MAQDLPWLQSHFKQRVREIMNKTSHYTKAIGGRQLGVLLIALVKMPLSNAFQRLERRRKGCLRSLCQLNWGVGSYREPA